MLTALTELSVRGYRFQHFHGLTALNRLKHLTVQQLAVLDLTGSLGATALVSLTLSQLTLTDSYARMLDILRSMSLLTKISLSKLEAADVDMLGLKALLELPKLENLCITRCDDLDYSLEADSCKISQNLTRLHLDIPGLVLHPEMSALRQLSFLVKLHLELDMEDTIYAVPSSLSTLSYLKELGLGPSHPWDMAQAIDITPLAKLGPAMEDVYLLGSTELFATGSLVALAEQPNLCHIWLTVAGNCCISSDGPSWLHCAALLHALLTRLSRGLSAVSVQPDLTSF